MKININKEIVNYIKNLQLEPKNLKQSVEVYSASPALYRGKPVPFSLLPLLFSEDEINDFKSTIKSFNSILHKVFKLLLNDKSLFDFFCFSKDELDFINLDLVDLGKLAEGKTGGLVWEALSFLRYDSILTADGDL